MALEHAILVSLAEKPSTGYDLARRFDKSIGYFWNASHQQIYRTLKRMSDDGWVVSTAIAQDGKPDKKIYAISEIGHAELKRWLAEPTPVTFARSEFAIKLRALRHGDVAAFRADVQRQRDEHQYASTPI